jgi:hypothetical protein
MKKIAIKHIYERTSSKKENFHVAIQKRSEKKARVESEDYGIQK